MFEQNNPLTTASSCCKRNRSSHPHLHYHQRHRAPDAEQEEEEEEEEGRRRDDKVEVEVEANAAGRLRETDMEYVSMDIICICHEQKTCQVTQETKKGE